MNSLALIVYLLHKRGVGWGWVGVGIHTPFMTDGGMGYTDVVTYSNLTVTWRDAGYERQVRWRVIRRESTVCRASSAASNSYDKCILIVAQFVLTGRQVLQALLICV